MANTKQLARIVAPNLSDPNYSNSLRVAFEAINENFKKLASAPFLQGVKGDSYIIDKQDIWYKDGTQLKTTEYGAILLSSIFDVNINKDVSFGNIKDILNEKNETKDVSGISAIDIFKETDPDTGLPKNNSLYFQVIKDDSGDYVESTRTVGQLYYFIDARVSGVGKSLVENKSELSDFEDYSGFYGYDNETRKYIKYDIVPTIYYSPENDDICWKINGEKTGVSAVGVQGKEGSSGNINIVRVDVIEPSEAEVGEISAVGIVNKNEESVSFKWIEEQDLFGNYLFGENALIFIKHINNVNNGIEYSYVFGYVKFIDGSYKAYWDGDAVFETLVTTNEINKYFDHLGYGYPGFYRQFLQIPIKPYDKANSGAGTHDIGSLYYSSDPNIGDDNGNLIFHCDNRMVNNPKSAVFSNYSELKIKDYKFSQINPGTMVPVTPINSNSKNSFTSIGKGKIVFSSIDSSSRESEQFVIGATGSTGDGYIKSTNGKVIIDSETEINNILTVASDTTLNGKLTVANDTTLNGKLTVEKETTLKKSLTVADTLTVNVTSGSIGIVSKNNNNFVDSSGNFNFTDGSNASNIPIKINYGINKNVIPTYEFYNGKNDLSSIKIKDLTASGNISIAGHVINNLVVDGSSIINNGVTISGGATIDRINGTIEGSGSIRLCSFDEGESKTAKDKNNCGDWDYTGGGSVLSITWSELQNRSWKVLTPSNVDHSVGVCGYGGINLNITGQSGTDKERWIVVYECPIYSICMLHIGVTNTATSNYDINNLHIKFTSRKQSEESWVDNSVEIFDGLEKGDTGWIHRPILLNSNSFQYLSLEN